MSFGGCVNTIRGFVILLIAPFIIGGITILLFEYGEYNLVVIPLVMIGEAILILAGIIDVEKKDKVEEAYNVNDSTKNG
jgi:hypothetical protein